MGVAFSLLPVIAFLVALYFLDSYKLISMHTLLLVMAAGAVVAGLSYLVNVGIIGTERVGSVAMVRYVGPLVEEIGKAAVCVVLFRLNRVGFMVDAAILGFAVGAGFACVENVYYLQATSDANTVTWVVRGFGTAIMHGGVTAILCVVTRTMLDRWQLTLAPSLLVGLVAAFALHSAYNHFLLPPLLSMLVVMVALPVIMLGVFELSEKATREWLGKGFDTDQELLRLILAGEVSDSNVGHYLETLKDRFAGPIVADMLCWLRIHLELAIEAKGILLMRQAGFDPKPSGGAKAKFEEMRYLETRIGKTGLLAITPLVHTSNRELWQLHVLGKSA